MVVLTLMIGTLALTLPFCICVFKLELSALCIVRVDGADFVCWGLRHFHRCYKHIPCAHCIRSALMGLELSGIGGQEGSCHALRFRDT
jgi:hypothetical protein